MKKIGKLFVLLIVVVLVWLFFKYDLGQYLSLEYLKDQKEVFQNYYQNHKIQTLSFFMIVYIISTALSLPGATILTLAGGALFGNFVGLVAVSFASTIGATLAFLVARFLLKDLVESKFKKRLQKINSGVEKEGAFYLFSLRLVPIFPFWMINILMGLTSMKVWKYFLVSQVGMLPGTFVYVNAGTQLGQITSLKGILSFDIFISFLLLGLFPLIAKKLLDYIKGRKYLSKYKKPKKFDYNIIAIGAGSAGLVTSYIAAAVKAKVALIEKHKMGGDCLNTGCVPSKALLKSAKVNQLSKSADKFGFNQISTDFEFSKIMNRVHNVIKKIEPHDSVERYEGLGVDCITGEAKILDPYTVQVNGKKITSKNLVIATGARPLVPPFKGLNDIKYATSDNLWDIKELPKKLVVLGGGPIGSELAQAFSRLGSEVTQVEMSDRIMGKEDKDVSDFVLKKFKSEGINVLTEHKAKEFVKKDNRQILVAEHSNEDVEIEFDLVLLALGRKANVTGFGLEELDIKIAKNGTIENDEFLRTNYPNIYVCGDVAGPYQFTHTASHQAWFASVNALFSPFKKFKADYSVIPWCTFTDPEVARVGLSEAEAEEQDIEFEVTKYGIDDLDRAIADSEDQGFVKVLTVPGKDKILGVTIVGNHAGDLIAEYVLAMKYNIGLNKILGTIHIYPTMAEANKYVAGNWKKAHAPEKLLKWVEKFHTWRRG